MKLLFVSPVSACFELENQHPYYAPEPYSVFLDGVLQFRRDTNVFSLFHLRPDTAYCVRAGEQELHFTTKAVTAAVSVRDFGAVGDGVQDDTAAIQTAILCLPEGGLLHFPEGTYRTSPLTLKSHITLSMGQGAVLLGETDRARYPVVPGQIQDIFTGEDRLFGTFEGNAVAMYQALLFAEHARDITIAGCGTVDGNAQNSDFWRVFRELPVARPRLLFFHECQDIRIHGITVQNSASWQIHPFFSRNIGLYDLQINAPKVSPNTDAIDPESCDHVEIVGCRFSVGDDCIAIKSGKIELGRTYRRSANHHTIRNCLMANGHGAVTLGSEIGAGVDNLSVSQCWFRGTDRGLRIKTRRGRGKDCNLDNILFENIRMENVLTPVAMNMWYNCCDPDRFSEYVWSREPLPVDERTPHLGRFTFRNLTCTGVQVAACYIDGLPEMPIDQVNFENCSFAFDPNAKPGKPIMKNFAQEECRLGLYLDNVRHIRLRQVTLEGQQGAPVAASHYETLEED